MTKAWKEYRDTITRLYITESRTLEEVKDIMQREHSFKASTRSYRQQFDKWQLGKYNCKKRNVRRLSQQSGIQIEASPTLIGIGSPDDGGPNSPSHSLASMSPELDHESSYYSPQVSAGIMYQQAHHSSQLPAWEHHQPERTWGQVPAPSPMGGHQQTGGSPGPSHLDLDDILRQTAQQTGHAAEMHSPHPVHPQSSYSVVLRRGEQPVQQPVQQNARIAPEYRYNPYPYQSGARCGFRR